MAAVRVAYLMESGAPAPRRLPHGKMYGFSVLTLKGWVQYSLSRTEDVIMGHCVVELSN